MKIKSPNRNIMTAKHKLKQV